MKLHQFAFVIVLISALSINGFAQVGINTITPDSSASLHIMSKPSGSGLIIPELTEAQRLAIVKPAKGLMVFDLDANLFYMNIDTAPGNQWYAINPFLTKGSASAPDVMYTSPVVTKVGIGVPNPQATLDVNGDIKSSTIVSANSLNINGFSTNALVPTGAIMMWSGDLSMLPAGWALCDGGTIGSFVTPDLRGRFIVGVGQNIKPARDEAENSNYKMGDVGGLNKYYLGPLESGLPSHTHTNAPHSHEISSQVSNNDKDEPPLCLTGAKCGQGRSFAATTDAQSIVIDPSTPQDAAQAHENRPSYYALAYIIKLP
ncbi:MAG: hypothetical protein ABI315_09845 [Bacteroidia bacterium]